jgi:hypothetical protein
MEVSILNGCISPVGCIAEVQGFGSRHACRWVGFGINLLHVLTFEDIYLDIVSNLPFLYQETHGNTSSRRIIGHSEVLVVKPF